MWPTAQRLHILLSHQDNKENHLTQKIDFTSTFALILNKTVDTQNTLSTTVVQTETDYIIFAFFMEKGNSDVLSKG